jgi:octaprenyl-diphosphate synthase
VTTHSDAAAGSLVGPLTLDALQGPVENGLDRVLDEIRRIVVSDFGMIEEVNDYLLMVRGKLFRPTLTLLSNHVGDRPDPRAVTLAAVVELVHLATLVHDDAVDHSVLRRGQPTVNALWTHQVAIIMGDYLYSRAVIELARLGIMDAVRIMGTAANEMSVGEMRQLTSYDALEFSERDYDRLIASKTASLMAAACEMGALVGEPTFRAPLRRFGHNLGMAFQIADDLLDYTGTEAETGKPTGHDLRERKVTLPLVATLRDASPGELSEIRALFEGEREPGDDEIARIVGIVRERGGLEYARRRAMEFAEAAEEALDEVAGGEARQSLRSCVVYATQRSR